MTIYVRKFSLFVMGSGKENSKEIFEKVRSGIERNNILTGTIGSGVGFVCKGENDALFYFKPTLVLKDGSLQGEVKQIEGMVLTGEVVANFTVEDSRYFYRSSLSMHSDQFILVPSDQLFKLQRREHIRVSLEDNDEKSVIIISFNGKKVFVDAECLDISVGGARIKIPQNGALTLKEEDWIIPVIRINGKRFETKAEVRHVRMEPGYQLVGIKFDSNDKEIYKRLQSLVLEYQRKLTISMN